MRERYRKSISILADFGGSKESVVRRPQRYVIPGLSGKLKNFGGKVPYHYNRRSNGTETPG